jgi:hypothetical protein
MGTFRDTDMGVSDMTPEHLDAIALQGGVVGAIGYSFTCNGSTPAPRHGYGFRWIDRRGMGNHGRLIMQGLTQRTRDLLWEGRRNRIMQEHDVDAETAERLLRCRARYARESSVIAAALATRNMNWVGYPGSGGGVRTWWLPEHPDIAVVVADLSAPRMDAVYAVVVELQRS